MITKIAIQGCRGFLERREILMCAGKRALSVCVLGDNGSGKSSIGDVIEFFFSPDGTVQRLGKRQTENNAGASALVHAKAAERKIKPEVVFDLDDGHSFQRVASAVGLASAMPDDVERLIEGAPVPRLMRSHEMKTFVTDEKGAARYEILARWVGLDRLTAIQDALKKLEGMITKTKWSDPTSNKRAQDATVAAVTQGAMEGWDERAIVDWLNELASKMTSGRAKKIKKASEFEHLAESVAAEQSRAESQTSVGEYRDIADLLERIDREQVLSRLIEIAQQRKQLLSDVTRLRAANKEADLYDVWAAAREYLTEHDDDSCPVCAHRFDKHVSRESVIERLEQSLSGLQELSDVENRLRRVEASLTGAVRTCDGNVAAIEARLKRINDRNLGSLSAAIAAVRDVCAKWSNDSKLSITDMRSAQSQFDAASGPAREHCLAAAERIRAEAGAVYADVVATIRQLMSVRDQWQRADAEERELIKVSEQFKVIADAIRAEIRSYVKAVIEKLETDVRAIYGALRGNDDYIPKVDIEVAEDKKSMNVAISLFGREGVPPSGYLSDSQLNSLGLAIYLAAIRRFNATFPFVVLDDVMSSYDASHRLNLVNVVNQFLTDHQVIITTHDEVFHSEMRTSLGSKGGWTFLRLKPWLLEPGIRFENDVAADDDIERRLRDGEKAEVLSQMIMGSVERWLWKLCSDGGCDVRFKVKKDGSTIPPTIGQLWASVQAQFDDATKAHPSYAILQGHALLNWPRHAGTSEKLLVSGGELQTFWRHFKTFREAFTVR